MPNDDITGPSSASLCIFDCGKFLERNLDDAELAQSVASFFLEDLARQTATLMDSVSRADLEAIASQAHRLKGASATVSGEALRALADQIECAAKNKALGEVCALAPRVPASADALAGELRLFLDRPLGQSDCRG